MIITAAAPESMLDACNHLAMCLAFSEADANTYNALNWQDDQGNLYAACSFLASEGWVQFAQASLVRPDWDTMKIIDMHAAANAQSAMVLWVPNDIDGPPISEKDALTVIGGMDGLDALSAMGLRMVVQEEHLP